MGVAGGWRQALDQEEAVERISRSWTLVKATPGSLSAQPTTTLTTPTGDVMGVGLQAWYNAGCAPVPTKARTWGQLKSLYR